MRCRVVGLALVSVSNDVTVSDDRFEGFFERLGLVSISRLCRYHLGLGLGITYIELQCSGGASYGAKGLEPPPLVFAPAPPEFLCKVTRCFKE